MTVPTPADPLHPVVRRATGRYLALADRLLPGRVRGFHLVGSIALGTYEPARSDIDFVAVLDRPLSPGELRRLRAVHVASGAATTARALARRQLDLPGTCNGVFVTATDVAAPVTQIRPVASHVAQSFTVGAAFDVNPVMWQLLAERGVTLRGPSPSELGVQPEPDALRAWNLANLDSYWRPWGERVLSRRRLPRFRERWSTAWAVLGPPRLHRTIACGDVVSKEDAGRWALEQLGVRWAPLVDDALSYRSGGPPHAALADPRVRAEQAGRFVLAVVDAAHAL